jgi:serine/threonine-protein kinase
MTDPFDRTLNSQDAATTPIGVTTLCPQCGAQMPAFETRCAACGHLKNPGSTDEQQESLRRRLQNGIGDAFELLDLLGKGGMGVVFRAREKSLEREVALKVLAFDPLISPDAFARFEREAKLAARLDHPHIVPIFAVGQGQGVAFYTMRIVRGGSLEDLLGREKRLESARAIRYLREIAAALDHAHAHGVVHRDIKPANIMLGDNDHVFVADFGIARAVTGQAGALTSTGVVGSPAYMAPEQWQGQGIDGRADQYALGILAYELLTGKRPYRDATMHELLRLHLTQDLPDITKDLPNVSGAVREALRRATAKEPEQRFESATAFVSALASALEGGNLQTAGAPLPGAEVSPSASPKRRVAVLAGIGAVVAAGTVFAITQSRTNEPPPAPARPETVRVNDTIRVPVASRPETVVKLEKAAPPAGSPPAGAATGAPLTGAGTSATSAPPPVAAPDTMGFVQFLHPMAPGGTYYIDGVAVERKFPPVFPVSPGPHRVSYKTNVTIIPDMQPARVRRGDTVRVTFLPAEGGGARGDSMRARLLENIRRARGGRGGPGRGGGAGRRGDTLGNGR